MRSISSGTPLRSAVSGSGSLWRIAKMAAGAVFPPKGNWPLTISYSTTPSDQISLRASAASLRACSGDMYPGVPTIAPVCVSRV